MPIEVDSNSIRIIGNDVQGIQFHDDDRVLRQALSLNTNNALVISGTLETPTMSGHSSWRTPSSAPPVDIDEDGITIWSSGKHLNMIRYLFDDAGTSRYQARMYAVYNSAIKAGEFWIGSVRDTGYPWTHCVLDLSAYDHETDISAVIRLTTENAAPRITANCDTYVTGDVYASGGFYVNSAPIPRPSLVDAVLGNVTNAAGGGAVLQCGWLANGRQVFGQAATAGVWTEANITNANYGALVYGGPFITLNGSDEYLTLADAAWNEVATYNLVAWWWVNTDNAAADQAIIGKTLGTADQSWLMYVDNALGWSFYVNGTGADADKKVVSSSYTISASQWMFVGVMFKPSSSIRIYVAEASEWALTMDENTTSIPASLHNSAADLRLGATSTPAQYFDGMAGGGAVCIAGGSDVDTYVAAYLLEKFRLTKYRYGG